MGPQIEVYHAQSPGLVGFLLLSLAGILGVISPLAYGLWRYNYAYTQHGPVAAEHWSRSWFLLSWLALATFAMLTFYRLLASRCFVIVHKNGLRFRLDTFFTRILLWKEIAGVSNSFTQEVFLNLPLYKRQQATLYPNVGRPVHLRGDLQNFPDLISRIKASLYPRLYPGLSAGFHAGQWLYFGPLSVQSQGLRLATTIPWPQVDRLEVREGCLVIALNGQGIRPDPLKIPVSQIPNLELLLQLVQQGVKV